MLAINFKSSMKKSMAAALFISLAGFGFNAASASTYESCTLVKQLQDPEENYNFVTRVAAARKASMSQYGESYTDPAVTIVRDGNTFEVDSFSFECLGCHDGSSSPSHDITFKSEEDFGAFSGAGLRSHPIGMHYGSASYVNNKLRKMQGLNPNMLFVDGRVGCLSCHNPLNPEGAHLVASNNGSNLCLTCHIQ